MHVYFSLKVFLYFKADSCWLYNLLFVQRADRENADWLWGLCSFQRLCRESDSSRTLAPVTVGKCNSTLTTNGTALGRHTLTPTHSLCVQLKMRPRKCKYNDISYYWLLVKLDLKSTAHRPCAYTTWLRYAMCVRKACLYHNVM